MDERKAPQYAILSHTWSDREVQYKDLIDLASNKTHSEDDWRDLSVASWPQVLDSPLDWLKVHMSCRQALADSIDYIWIDTCCIDKSSSAELSEAINSMFRYYEKAAVCYAFLSDVLKPLDGAKNANRQPFEQSRWFTRGWTLQELIAPSKVMFFDRHWNQLGEKSSLADSLHEATNIPLSILRQQQALGDVSIAMRMSWAAKRETTRVEDQAYCLLGIFDVNMPMLYGEGSKVFARLQAEILRSSDDQTIFAWHGEERSLLAPSPSHFVKASTIVHVQNTLRSQYEVHKRGIRIALKLGEFDRWNDTALAILNCIDPDDPDKLIALRLQIRSKNEDGITEATLAKDHSLHFVDGTTAVWPHTSPKVELLMLVSPKVEWTVNARSPSTATPVKLVVDADLSHLPIFVRHPEEWGPTHFITTLPHTSSADGGHRRTIFVVGLQPDPDLEDGQPRSQLQSHLVVVFGYNHDMSTTPWGRRPLLQAHSCPSTMGNRILTKKGLEFMDPLPNWPECTTGSRLNCPSMFP